MKHHKKIAIIGGTGKSGRYLVKEMIQQGYSLKVLVRNPNQTTFQHPLLEIIEGNVLDFEKVQEVVQSCQAVISALGLGIPPSQSNVFSLATTNILKAMKKFAVPRYILLTGLNVDTANDRKSLKAKLATDWMLANYPISTADRQLEYELLLGSTVDWTLIRLPLIEQSEERRLWTPSLEDCPGDKISTTTLADFMIGQLTDGTYIRKAPFVAEV